MRLPLQQIVVHVLAVAVRAAETLLERGHHRVPAALDLADSVQKYAGRQEQHADEEHDRSDQDALLHWQQTELFHGEFYAVYETLGVRFVHVLGTVVDFLYGGFFFENSARLVEGARVVDVRLG